MDHTQRKQNQEDATTYLANVSDRYIFDGSGGLYAQKTSKHQENSSTDTAGRNKRFPFWVSVQRDWFALLVSVATLVLLGATVRYAYKQWQEIAVSTRNAATFFRLDERAWVGIESVEPIRMGKPAGWSGGELTYFRVTFKNYGKSSARKVQVRANNRGYIVGNLTQEMIENDFLLPSNLLKEPVPAILGPGNDTFIGKGAVLLQKPYMSFGHKMGFAFVGRIDYEDIFGKPHWYTFCYIIIESGSLVACDYGHNEDQENPNP